MGCSSILTADPIEASVELAKFVQRAAGAGAVASFAGIARPASRLGGQVDHLHLEHYPGMTERSLAAIAGDGMARFDVSHVAVVHRHGTICPGEAIVFVAAASRHRRAAFLAVDYLMDRLKTEAVFWKREHAAGSSVWIEPTSDDHADNARWRR